MPKAEGLQYEAIGDGEAVLLIHGALIADAMLPLMREPALAEHYRLICYHRRGYGGSDPQSGPISIEQPTQEAQALLKHLGEERAQVVGFSGGGAIAVQLAIEAPRLVHSLVLLEPAILTAERASGLLEMAAPVLEAHRSGDGSRAADLWMDLVNCGPDWRTEVANTLPGAPEQADRDSATTFGVELPSLEKWVIDADRASRISQPILYVTGGESGPLAQENKRYLQSLIPHVEEVVVPGVNHLMMIRDPKAVAAPIADFLSRHPL